MKNHCLQATVTTFLSSLDTYCILSLYFFITPFELEKTLLIYFKLLTPHLLNTATYLVLLISHGGVKTANNVTVHY